MMSNCDNVFHNALSFLIYLPVAILIWNVNYQNCMSKYRIPLEIKVNTKFIFLIRAGFIIFFKILRNEKLIFCLIFFFLLLNSLVNKIW